MTVAELVARTQRMKAAGDLPEYPQHRPFGLSVLTKAPCRHEGAVLSPCHGCQGQDRHVRWCHHDAHHSCVRNAPDKASEDVTNCASCPDHAPVS